LAVVGDIAGFAAAVYQRGCRSFRFRPRCSRRSIRRSAGKTGVNHALGKNMIGAFYQPRAVLIDTECLRTLPPRELSAGLAEVIKYGAIRDVAFFAWLEAEMPRLRARDTDALTHAITQSCRIKAQIVAADERESGERALLNFGHTFGHAIETGIGYGEWLHGEAVAAGMIMAAKLSARLGWIEDDDALRLAALVDAAGLPVEPPPMEVERWLTLLGRDKKVDQGKVHLVLLRALGRAVVTAEFDGQALEAVLTS
jgi:3-dehydroquinate synthase